MKLSIVIPCYNAASTLGFQLEALITQHWSQPWEIILADNRSTDHSRQVAEKYRERFPNLRVVDAFEKQGSGHATNAGIKASAGELIALCDADDEVAPGWVAAMGEALCRHEFVAGRFETAKLNPEWMHGHEQEHGLQTIWYPPWLPHAGGGNMGFTRALFDAVGGFDEEMVHLQDTEFCFRVQKLGHSLHFVPDAVLHVRRRDSLLGHYRQSRNYAEYNVIIAKRYWSKDDSPSRYLRAFLTEWYRVVRRLPELRTKGGRFNWMWRLGRQVGRSKGLLLHGGVPV